MFISMPYKTKHDLSISAKLYITHNIKTINLMAKTKLSISLIKSGVSDIDEMVRITECRNVDIPDVGTFYYNNSSPKEPSWVSNFFMGKLGDEPRLKTSFVQGLLIVKREYGEETRYFAIAFGYGRNLLIPGAIEPRFGLKTTLNIINPQRLRSVDKNSLESIPTKGRVQSSRLSDQGVFNLDKERDILRSITAKTSDEKQDDFGGTVSGSDSLHFSQEVDITTIKDLLDKCYKQYKLDTYKTDFDWIDYLESIKDPDVIDALNTDLISSINNNDLNTIWMAIPELLNWESQLTFHLGGGRGNESEDLNIYEVLSVVFHNRDDITVEELKKKHVKATDSSGIKVGEWSYYRCLYGEVIHDNSLYILNEGEWFKVDDNYNDQVMSFYENAAICPKELIDYKKSDREDVYNKYLADSDPAFCLLDKKLVSTGVLQNSIEVCDVLTEDKFIIHIKKRQGSSVLSHLFNQGYVSGIMLMQQQFRKNVNNIIKANVHAEDINKWAFSESMDYNPSQYTIVFGIITGEDTKRPKIPFFSKIAFRQVATSLANNGYSVCLANIYTIIDA